MYSAKSDCRRFIGEKPCQPGRECFDCADYSPMGTRLLIIKLGAGGDVLRTACLLPGLKQKYPVSHITWVTEKPFVPLLARNPSIDRLLRFEFTTVLTLVTEYFDQLICLDKVPEAISLAEQVNSSQKFGFGMDRYGSLRPFNKRAEYAFRLGLSDQLKFKENTLTYPEMIYEICDLPYDGQAYQIWLNDQQSALAHRIKDQYGRAASAMIGLNTGSGPVFATKKWPIDHWLELARLLYHDRPAALFLLGGPDEKERNELIRQKSTVPLVDMGTDNSLERFIAIIAALDLVITCDSLALHIALALGKKVVVLFGSTSATEIDLFGQGLKIVSDFRCSPCYRKTCDLSPMCMDKLEPLAVFEEVKKLITN